MKWDYHKTPVPLGIDDAIRISREWVKKSEHAGDVNLESVSLLSFHPNELQFKNFFYYKVILSYKFFDRVVCVVLLDGSVLEPKRIFPED